MGAKPLMQGEGVREGGHKFEHSCVVRHVSIQLKNIYALLFYLHQYTCNMVLLRYLYYSILEVLTVASCSLSYSLSFP